MHLSQGVLLAGVVVVGAGCDCNDDPPVPDGTVPRTPGTDPVPGPPPANFGSWLSLRVAADGAGITMSSYDRIAGAVDFAVGTPGADGAVAWSHEPVDGYPDAGTLVDPGDRGRYATHATAPDGTVWLAYQDTDNGSLRVARRPGTGGWEPSVVVDEGTGVPADAGTWASLAIDGAGQPVVASCDHAGAAVRLSRLSGTAWSTSTVATSVDVSVTGADGTTEVRPAGVSHTALLVDGPTERVAYYDSAAGSLVLLEGSGTSFVSTVIDDAGDVGRWPSLLSSDGTLYVAYEDVGNEDLRLATRTGAAWTIEVVDAGVMRGADSALFLDGGEPSIVYFDGYDNDQWLAKRAGTDWALTRLGGEGSMLGFHNEVVTTSAGRWVGAYDLVSATLVLEAL